MWKFLNKLDCILARRDFNKLLLLLIPVTGVALLEVLGIYSILPFMTIVADPEVVKTDARFQWLMSTFGFSSSRHLMIWLGLTVLAMQLVTAFSTVLTGWMTQRLIWNLAHRISMNLLLHYARQPYEFYLNNNSADMVKKAISDIQSLVSGVLLVGSQFVVNGLKSLAILIFLLFINFRLALTAFTIFGGIYLLIHLVRHQYLNQLGKLRLASYKERLKTFSETIAGIKTLQISGAIGYFVGRFETASKQFSEIHPKVQLYNLIPQKIVEFVAIGGIVVVILFQLLAGKELTNVIPVLSVFALATFKLLPALSTAFLQAASLSHNLPVVDELHEDTRELEKLLRPIEEYAAAAPLEFRNSIVLDNISYKYTTSGLPALRNIDLEIRKGLKYAFVGSTGCGKSTLVDVLVGLLRPTEGVLRINATKITTENVYGWQKTIAYVPQEVFLFDDTIAANIALGITPEKIDTERLKLAARLAQVQEFVESEYREGFDTIVGEKGVRLSGGQRQRIGLARAFYQQPEVLFLDEATSALDSVTEQAIVAAIERELPDVTVVMVAHRLTSTRFCDSIILMDEGRIAGSGSFEQLMKSSNQFREMVEITD